MNQEKIGKFISKLRKEKNMTQEQLAEKVGVTNKSISRWENGKTMPDYSVLEPLCDELGISINELLNGERIKATSYELKANETLDDILKEYYKMKKQKRIITTILIVLLSFVVLFIVRALIVLGVASLTSLAPAINISGIENYNKNYYIEEYQGDLDSNLSIFPDDKSNLLDATFSSSFKTNLFDSDGYIILTSKYSKEDFDNEVDRLSKLSITISENSHADSATYTNYIKYDEDAYEYPAYISVDGFRQTYEYALINEMDSEIIYVYLSYPSIDNPNYKKYLKKDKSAYSNDHTLDLYSMYSHSFDDGQSFMEFDD